MTAGRSPSVTRIASGTRASSALHGGDPRATASCASRTIAPVWLDVCTGERSCGTVWTTPRPLSGEPSPVIASQ